MFVHSIGGLRYNDIARNRGQTEGNGMKRSGASVAGTLRAAEKEAKTGLRVWASSRFTSRLVMTYWVRTHQNSASSGRNTGMMNGTAMATSTNAPACTQSTANHQLNSW